MGERRGAVGRERESRWGGAGLHMLRGLALLLRKRFLAGPSPVHGKGGGFPFGLFRKPAAIRFSISVSILIRADHPRSLSLSLSLSRHQNPPDAYKRRSPAGNRARGVLVWVLRCEGGVGRWMDLVRGVDLRVVQRWSCGASSSPRNLRWAPGAVHRGVCRRRDSDIELSFAARKAKWEERQECRVISDQWKGRRAMECRSLSDISRMSFF